jgi:predicted nucleotidyltransferase
MSNKFGLKERDLEDIIPILQQQPQVESAVIFGSRAKGNYKNGSDVDIALRGDLVNLQVISQISYLLNEETFMPYKFDIVNYN